MTIQTFSNPSKKYSNISYVFCANSFEPDKGYLNYALLRHNVRISAILTIREPLLNDYKQAIIMLAYKQVKSKWARRNKQAVNTVVIRENLEQTLKDYPETTVNNFTETKILLLNDKALDKNVGDTGIQCLFRFEKHDATSEFMLSPGEALRNLTSMIGLGVFEADSVEDVLEDIISEMLDLTFLHIIPQSGILVTPALREDIMNYLHFCFYGKENASI